eukprot:5928235-Pyramimonas_sp.AAC.2
MERGLRRRRRCIDWRVGSAGGREGQKGRERESELCNTRSVDFQAWPVENLKWSHLQRYVVVITSNSRGC